jgi:hypothetical protein
VDLNHCRITSVRMKMLLSQQFKLTLFRSADEVVYTSTYEAMTAGAPELRMDGSVF